jgi:hypothetical protein
MYHVRLLRGLKEPYKTSQQLIKAEQMAGFWKKGILLLFITLIVSALTAYFGIGNELLSKNLNGLSSTEFETIKSLFAAGQVSWSLLAAIIIITVPSLFFWTVSDIEWKKYIVVQYLVVTILLIEKGLLIPFAIFMGLPEVSNPFSLGIIGQYLTSNDIILQFLTQLSIFKIWAVVLQYKYVKVLSKKSALQTALIVIGFNLILMIVHGLITMMDLEKLL